MDEPKDQRKELEPKPASESEPSSVLQPELAPAGTAPEPDAASSATPSSPAPGPATEPGALVLDKASAKPQEAKSAIEAVIGPAIGEPETAVAVRPPLAPAAGVRAAYEHPWVVRFCHWLNAVALLVMVLSGLQILDAFPSFGPKVPEKDFINAPGALKLGGWLGGGIQWHFTFMWIFVGTGALYLGYQILSGHYKTVLFTPKDIPGVWPMARHYFLFGPEPTVTEQYNPLQKLAYTATVLCGVASLLTGIVIYKPVQFSWLAWMMGGFHLARMWHFAAMCGFLAFIPGHLLMVALHGWNNFTSMLTGWKKDPEYL